MPSDNTSEPRRPTKSQSSGVPPPEQEHLPCPRCDSTHTKFCYYNNYNFSQPRHFCKSCRRYWTQGGTLRDIPVGGGSRKNAKRSRTSSSATSATISPHSTHEHSLPATPVFMSLSPSTPASLSLGAAVASASCDPLVKSNLNVCGNFTSLLNNTAAQAPGYLSFGGFGIGIGHGLEEMGLGMGRGIWPFTGTVEGDANVGSHVGPTGVGNAWHLESGEGGFVHGDCFSWPDLAISTPGNGLK